MSEANGFDWPALMRAAFQGLGLSPAEFWALTPTEFLILLGPESGAAPLRRDAFEALLARFPDTKDEDPDDRDG
ncbi:rcc01693 family protein [Gymnodinialimonas hymeniacidonis]|uniref:rcc01693 family protein n=1 Tax=Gymnodinialimonas hymeniacidonis TaxID=3126508 RepID=UPI0034C60FFC